MNNYSRLNSSRLVANSRGTLTKKDIEPVISYSRLVNLDTSGGTAPINIPGNATITGDVINIASGIITAKAKAKIVISGSELVIARGYVVAGGKGKALVNGQGLNISAPGTIIAKGKAKAIISGNSLIIESGYVSGIGGTSPDPEMGLAVYNNSGTLVISPSSRSIRQLASYIASKDIEGTIDLSAFSGTPYEILTAPLGNQIQHIVSLSGNMLSYSYWHRPSPMNDTWWAVGPTLILVVTKS